MRKNCSSDQEKLLELEAEGREFEKVLRSLEQFIRTVKGQNKLEKNILLPKTVLTFHCLNKLF